MTELKYIRYEKQDGIATVTIDRPEVLNALDRGVLEELDAVIADLGADDSLRVAVLTGAGKAFVAGADIAAMRDMTSAQGRSFNLYGQTVLNALEDCPIPTIAAINGYALGGGLELAMACDIRIASVKAKLGTPEVKLGIFPGFGGTQRLPRLINPGLAKYYIYTGDMIPSDKALELGIVQQVTEPEALMETVMGIAKTIAGNSPVGIRMAKRTINHGQNVGLKDAVAFDSETYAVVFGTEDRVNGMTAFLNKATPEFNNR